MSTQAINSTTPSTAINLAVLLKLLDKLLDAADRNSIVLGSDEHQLLDILRYGAVSGSGTVSGIVVTYT